MAIAKYRSVNRDLPMSVAAGPMGRQSSWRALIGPYLLEQRGYTSSDFKYRFEESWDSACNKQFLLDALGGFYSCPSEKRSSDYPFVTYVMLTRGVPEWKSLPEDAVLIVESAECKIEYGEPRDLDIETLFDGDSPFGVGKLNSFHPGVVKALRVDGKVIDIPKNISKEKLRKLLMGTSTRVRDNADR